MKDNQLMIRVKGQTYSPNYPGPRVEGDDFVNVPDLAQLLKKEEDPALHPVWADLHD